MREGGVGMFSPPGRALLRPEGSTRAPDFMLIVLGVNELGCLIIDRNLELGLPNFPNRNTQCLVKFDFR